MSWFQYVDVELPQDSLCSKCGEPCSLVFLTSEPEDSCYHWECDFCGHFDVAMWRHAKNLVTNSEFQVPLELLVGGVSSSSSSSYHIR